MLLGEGLPAMAALAEKKTLLTPDSLLPQSLRYSLQGLNLPTGQNFLIRARGRYRVRGSESTEDYRTERVPPPSFRDCLRLFAQDPWQRGGL